MNNTKWREFFEIIGEENLQFQVAWMSGDSEWNTNGRHQIQKEIIEENGLRDPGIGGPCLFRNILWVRIPRHWTTKQKNGDLEQVIDWNQNLSSLAERLSKLGLLPIEETEDFIEIKGYD